MFDEQSKYHGLYIDEMLKIFRHIYSPNLNKFWVLFIVLREFLIINKLKRMNYSVIRIYITVSRFLVSNKGQTYPGFTHGEKFCYSDKTFSQHRSLVNLNKHY